MELSRQNIADMLGVEFDEKFNVTQRPGETYRLNKMCGLQILNKNSGDFYNASQNTLYELLSGNLTIQGDSCFLTKKEREYINKVLEPYVNLYKLIRIGKTTYKDGRKEINIALTEPTSNSVSIFCIDLPTTLYGKETYKKLDETKWYIMKNETQRIG